MNQSQASQHVDELAAELGCTLRRGVPKRDRRGAKAYQGANIVRTYGVNTDQDYLTALHELGHIAIGDYGPARRLEEEADAWSWALEKARWPVNGAVKRHIGECLSSYIGASETRESREPQKSHPFWEMVRWKTKYAKPRRRVRERRLP